jgi:hypothetical protein
MADYITTLRGTIATGVLGEIFSHSLAIRSSATMTTLAEDLKNSWNNTWQAGGSNLSLYFPPEVEYTEATAATIIDWTLPKVSAAFHASFPVGTTGANINGMLPAQNAVAVSLVAGVRDNGVPLRGRFYLPTLGQDTVEATSGVLLTSVQTAIAGGIRSFFNALTSQGHTPCVWSRTTGAFQPVTLMRVGNRVDTIRSRRNAGVEAYVVA